MELPSKMLEQIAYNTRPKTEEHMSIVIFMEKSTHEEHLFQPLHFDDRQFEMTEKSLTDYIGIFNVSSKNTKFYFTISINDDDFTQNKYCTIGYEIESFDNEIKRIIIEEGHLTEDKYPFKIKSNFCTLGTNMELSSSIKGGQFDFTPSITIRDLLGFKPKVIFEDCNLSDYRVEILSIDNVFLEFDVAHGMIFKSKGTGLFHNFAMHVDPAYKYIEKFRIGIQ